MKIKNYLTVSFLLCAMTLSFMLNVHCQVKKTVSKENIKYYKDWDPKLNKGINEIKSEDVPYSIDYYMVTQNQNGVIQLIQSFKDKKANGFWTYFDENGKPVQLEYWNDGKRKQVIKYK